MAIANKNWNTSYNSFGEVSFDKKQDLTAKERMQACKNINVASSDEIQEIHGKLRTGLIEIAETKIETEANIAATNENIRVANEAVDTANAASDRANAAAASVEDKVSQEQLIRAEGVTLSESEYAELEERGEVDPDLKYYIYEDEE